MKLIWNLLVTFALMVAVLMAAGLLGGVGTVELSIWTVLVVIALVVVGMRSRRQSSG